MATTSYTIYSHYDPEDRAQLERETGQIPTARPDADDAELEDAAEDWALEASSAFKRRIAPAPRFVPATVQDGEWNKQDVVPSQPPTTPRNEISTWYKSLNRASAAVSRGSTPSTSSAATPSHSTATTPAPKLSRSQAAEKDLWFIRNAIRSEPASSSSSSSTLADILAREPPPLPNQPKFKPPVFLTIGPSNKGFTMLEKSGWNEGEALGPDIIRRKRIAEQSKASAKKGKRRAVESSVKEETIEVSLGGDDDVKEIRKVSVVDLTISSDSESASEFEDESESTDDGEGDQVISQSPPPAPSSSSDRKALITPLRTILKSDRLGIGLKAKTVGPHKESKKRVTHGAAALASHIQASEELHRRKRKFGKGKRGLAREHKKEQASRQAMLAYMNE